MPNASVRMFEARTWKSSGPEMLGVPVEETAGRQPAEFSFATQNAPGEPQ
jgi:hypothetical protein